MGFFFLFSAVNCRTGSLETKKIKFSTIAASELPHRQLRKVNLDFPRMKTRELPHRQLRKNAIIYVSGDIRELPHRQLRKFKVSSQKLL